ncbi:MAG: hypothetical protein MUC50_04720 [Myxococcota bacterium]|nr:hypothetical protein [Myxococcota bacterium]
MQRHPAILASIASILLALPASAVDGISVTTHWSGQDTVAYGGFGQIWRHDIADNRVMSHTLLYADDRFPGRAPVLSPDGTQIAFIRADGSIAILSIDGGEPVILQGAATTPQAFLDWPVRSWIYYAKGGLFQPTASRYLHRVSPSTDRDEPVLTFKKDDTVTDSGVWRFRIAGDLRRALVRTDDYGPEPFGRIVAMDLLEDKGVLRLDRATDRFSCSEALSPDGALFIDGHQDHMGVDIRRWDDLSTVSSLRYSDIESWGPDTGALGNVHNLNNWSANSADWISIHLAYALSASEVSGGNQVLINWRDGARIAVTQNTDGSFEFDCAGDFFLTSQANDITPASIVSVKAERRPDRILVSFSEPVLPSCAANASTYSVEPHEQVLDAQLVAEDQVQLTVQPLSENMPYILRLEAAISDRAAPPNELPAGTVMPFQYFSGQGPLEVEAGTALEATIGEPVFLSGSAKRGGLPIEGGLVQWEIEKAPAEATLEQADSLATFATFRSTGIYTARLTVQHLGQVEAAEVDISVLPEPTIVLLSPQPGQTLRGGQLEFVEWTADRVSDVTVYVSMDGRASWDMVALTVDTSSPYWGRFPWLVPTQACDDASLLLEEYSQVTSTTAESLSIAPRAFDLAVVAPEPASKLVPGEPVTVVVQGAHGPVRLEFSLDAGRTFELVEVIEPGEEGRIEHLWTAPGARTFWALLRATEPSTGAMAHSGVFSISPKAASHADGDSLVGIRVAYALPTEGTPTELRVDGAPVTGHTTESVVVELPWPAGVKTYVFEVRGQTPTAMFRRLATVTIE